MNKQEIQPETGSWVCRVPRSYLLWGSQRALKEHKASFVRTVLIVSVFMAVLYALIESLPWDEAGVSVNKLFLITSAVGLGISVFTYIVNPYFMRFSRAQYIVNAKGIRISGRFYLWKRICSCQPPKMNEPIEGVLSVLFKAKSSDMPVPLIFDAAEEEFARAVYAYIEEHIPQRNRQWIQKPKITLTKHQHVFMTVLSLSTVIAVIAARPFAAQLSKDVAAMFFILFCYAGPGTWGILALYGKRIFSYRKWFGPMLAYNALAFFVLVLTGIFYIIIRLRSLL